MFERPLLEKQFHILSTDVVKVKSFSVANVNSISPSEISKLFCEFPSQIAYFHERAYKKDMLFVVLCIMQVTFVTVPMVGLNIQSQRKKRNRKDY